MNNILHLVVYLGVGTIGGILGAKLKVPAGAMMGAMVGVILVKLGLNITWGLPKSYGFVVQILLGVMLGTLFYPAMLNTLSKMAIPIVLSTVMLIATGFLLAVIFTKLGLVDLPTAYIGTSPGAMTSLVVLASESQVDAPLITCFHFFRLVVVIVTAPFILKCLSG